MKYFVFSLILLFLSLSGCGQKGSTRVKIDVASSLSISGITSGTLIIFGSSGDADKAFAAEIDANTPNYEQTLTNGNWNFAAVHWSGGSPFQAPVKCSNTVTQNLAGGDIDVALSLNSANCNQAFWGPSGISDGATLKVLNVISCAHPHEQSLAFNATTLCDGTSTNPEKGKFNSYQIFHVEIPEEQTFSELKNNTSLENNTDYTGNFKSFLPPGTQANYISSCISISADSQGPSGYQLPVFLESIDAAKFFLVAYESTDCTGGSGFQFKDINYSPTSNNLQIFSSYVNLHIFDEETSPALECLPGYHFEGRCYYLGDAGESCDETCANLGKSYNYATKEIIGFDIATYIAQTTNCQTVANGILNSSFSYTNYDPDSSRNGMGCFVSSDETQLFVHQANVDSNSSASSASHKRICSCGDDFNDAIDLGIRYAYSVVPGSTQVGTCAGPFTIELQDEQGSPYTINENHSLAASSTDIAFFSDSSCLSSISSFDFNAGSSSKTFYASSTKPVGFYPTLTRPQGYEHWNLPETPAFNFLPGPAVRVGMDSYSYHSVRMNYCGGLRAYAYDAYDNQIPFPSSVVVTSTKIGDTGGVTGMITHVGSCTTYMTTATRSVPAGATQSDYFYPTFNLGANNECGYSEFTISAPGLTSSTVRVYLDNSPYGECVP